MIAKGRMVAPKKTVLIAEYGSFLCSSITNTVRAGRLWRLYSPRHNSEPIYNTSAFEATARRSAHLISGVEKLLRWNDIEVAEIVPLETLTDRVKDLVTRFEVLEDIQADGQFVDTAELIDAIDLLESLVAKES